MEKYKTKSVEELTKTLKVLALKVGNPGLSAELKDFLCMLKAHKLRHNEDAHAFCESGGMQVLLDMLKCCEASSRDSTLVLGTIGNLCALNRQSRDIIIKEGLERIVGYLQTSITSDGISTTARVLANLALDRDHIPALHELAVVEQLTRLLAQGDMDVNCKKNVVRALRLFCSADECLEELKKNDGVLLLLDCLKSDHVELAESALQAVEMTSTHGDPDVLQWLCNKETMQCLIRYCNHSKFKIRKRAMCILLSSAKILDGRIALSSAGGVETLVAHMESSNRTSTMYREVVCALCTCCRDVISRQRLRDCGGLERMIAMLADTSHAVLHQNIMSALVCYYFDENTLKLMVTKMGLLQTLSYHLKRMTSRSKEVCGLPYHCMEARPSSDSTELEEAYMESMTESSQSLSDDQDSSLTAAENPPPTKRPRLTDPESPPPSKHPRLDLETPPQSKLQTLEMSPLNQCPRLDPEMDASGSTPISFLDSLLSSPSPYKSSVESSRPPDSPTIGDFNSTFESQVILMISRMSHMRDCLVSLSYTDMLLAIVDFFVSSRPPNVHISKVLTRVFMNPHCFQNCVSSFVPSKIYKILRQSDLPLPPASDGADASFFGCCLVLMEHISKNAESPYGQGVLAHLLLRGSDKEKQASCLSIPLLCRSPRVCQKLMVDYGAFQVLCELLKDEGDEELWEMALDSMLALGHNMHLQQVPRYRRRYSALPPDLQLQVRRFPFSRLDFSFRDLSLSEAVLPHQQQQQQQQLSRETSMNDDSADMAECRQTYCKHLDTDHHPFDVTIILHTPAGGIVRVPAHQSTLVEECDVFRVMLGGSYKESLCGQVHIHSISPCGFLSTLHHIYGCGWQCKTVLDEVSRRGDEEKVEASSSQSDLLSQATDTLLREIASVCGSREDGVRVEHCLQVLACGGRFLLPDLITLSEHTAVKYLCPGNLVAMFHFAQLHQCFCLAESCIHSLVSLPHLQLRTDIFRELLTSSEGEAALQIILLFLTAADF